MGIPRESPGLVRFAEFEMDLRTRELRTAVGKIKLQEQPSQVLALLLERPGEAVTREELTRRLWPSGTFVDFEHSLNKAVNRLREALGDSAESPRFIETLPRLGYRFIGPLNAASSRAPVPNAVAEAVASDAMKSGVINGPPAAAGTGNPVLSGSRSRMHAGLRIRTRVLAAIATVSVVAACFGVYKWLSLRPKFSIEAVRLTKFTDSGAAEVAAISPDGRYITYTVRQGEKVGVWLRQLTVKGRVESGIGILPPDSLGIWGLTFSPDGNYIYFPRAVRNDPFSENLYMMPVLGGRAQLVITDVGSPLSFAPDGREFAFIRKQGRDGVELRVANVDGSGERLLTAFRKGDTAAYLPGPSWSPDGRTIAVPVLLSGVGWVLGLVSAADGSMREIWSNPVPIGHPVWLPGGNTLLLPLVNWESRRGELWTISVPGGKGRRFTNDLTDYSPHLDITRDGLMVAATASTWVFNIWSFSASDLSTGRQITSGELPMLDVVELLDGRLVSISQDGYVWVVKADGSDRRLLTGLRGSEPLDACGRFVFFNSSEGSLTRIDADGASTPIRASSGLITATCTPDGNSVFYVTQKSPRKIMRLQVEGGRPTEIAEVRESIPHGRLSLSADGRLLAFVSVEDSTSPSWKVTVIGADGGLPVKTFNVPGGIRKLIWSPSSQGLQYLVTRDGASNIWEQSLAGGEPHQVTNFTSGVIAAFSWSLDHKRLLITRGSMSNNVVLLDFRSGDGHK